MEFRKCLDCGEYSYIESNGKCPDCVDSASRDWAVVFGASSFADGHVSRTGLTEEEARRISQSSQNLYAIPMSAQGD